MENKYWEGRKQYIGARYVPRFADPIVWDKNKAYESLEMVTYLGATYTSRVPVPPGVEITNTDYWALTGNYNVQVEEYRQAVEQLKQQHTQDVDNLQGQITDNDQKDTAAITELTNELTHLTSRFNKPLSVILVGDSYGTGTGYAGGNVENPYPQQVATLLRFMGYKCSYNFINGAGFCNGGYLNALNTVINSFTDNKDEVTDIYILGGWNDENGRPGVSWQAVQNSALTFRDRARAVFPNAVIHLAFISWTFRTGGITSNIIDTWNWYYYLGGLTMSYIDDLAYIMHNRAFVVEDLGHPNATGMLALTRGLMSVILGGSPHVYYKAQKQCTAYDTLTYSGLPTFTETLNGDTLEIKSGNSFLVTIPQQTLTINGGEMNILNYENQLYNGATPMSMDIELIIFGDTTVHGTGKLVFKSNLVSIYLPTQYASYGNFVTVENAKYIAVRSNTQVYPAIY